MRIEEPENRGEVVTEKADKIKTKEGKVNVYFLNNRKTIKGNNFKWCKRVKIGGNFGKIFF